MNISHMVIAIIVGGYKEVNKVKQCKQCGEFLPLSEDFFYIHAPSKDGFRGVCINCYKQKSKTVKKKDYKKKTVEIDRDLIIKLRKSKGISRDRVSKECNIPYSTYEVIEKKSKRTSFKNWEKIKNFYGLD